MTKPTVLLVDDHPFFTTMLRNVLEQQGYQVVAANGGKEGLAAAQQHHPAVIVLDVQMPGMDGFAVCAALKKDAELKKIPVVILTGVEDAKLNEKAFKAGAAVTALKSLSGDRLVNILKLVLGPGVD